jgi:PilZ domain
MADETAHELAELAAHVFPALPFDAAARSRSGGQVIAVQRRDADRYLVNWSFAAPMPGEDVELSVVRDSAVYTVRARVTGIDRGNARYITITELRRKTQRRRAPRAAIDELVLISTDGDIDAKLVDVSADGFGFVLDRPLQPDITIKTVINFDGSVIPATATVKNIAQIDDGVYRIGCAFNQIADHHHSLLDRYASNNPIGRRKTEDGLLRRLRRAA